MKALGVAVLAAAAFAAGAGVGRLSLPQAESAAPASLASFRDALEDPNWLTRSTRISAYLAQLGPEELPPALAAIERRRAWLDTGEIRLFMLAWARFDAPAALERALTWPGRSRRTAAGAAIYAWAFYDPDAASRALDALEDDQLRDYLRTRLVAGWVRSERKDDANRYIASLPDGPQRDSLAGMLARELNERGSEAVMSWAEGIPELLPGYKRTAFRKACAALAASDPELAVRWAAEHAGHDYADGSETIIAGRWASVDPQAAIEWLLTQPRDAARDRAIGDAFGQWLSFARTAAEGWLRDATPAEGLDEAVRAMVRRAHQHGSPEAAAGWALQIDDDELREEVLVALTRAWLHRDPAAARAWLESAELPDALRAAIRSPSPSARAGRGGTGGGR